MVTWDKAIPYFTVEELACKGSGVIALDVRFASSLPALRETWNRSLIPTSVCRTPEHNTAVGGHPNSLHLTVNHKHPTHGTMAADISWRYLSTSDKMDFAKLAWSFNWSLGLHYDFCHIDLRAKIGLKKTIYTYPGWGNLFFKSDIMA